MPEGTQRTPSLYERDYYAWASDQAAKLRGLARQGGDSVLDLENLAEEVDDLGRSERDAVHSQIRRIIEHFLKLEYSPADRPRGGWRESIADARVTLGRKLTPTLRADALQNLESIYSEAVHVADAGMSRYDEKAHARFPQECPYTFDRILEHGWYPARRAVSRARRRP